MNKQNIIGPLFVKKCAEADPQQFQIESNFSGIDGNWDDIYVSFGGFFGAYGPHVFAAAPDLLEALEELEALGSLDLPHRRDAALLKAKAAIAKAKGEQQ